MGLKMTVGNSKLASQLTKYVRTQAELFYDKGECAKIDAFTVGYLESLIARILEKNPDARQYVLESMGTK